LFNISQYVVQFAEEFDWIQLARAEAGVQYQAVLNTVITLGYIKGWNFLTC
jgi:hypothetical protein